MGSLSIRARIMVVSVGTTLLMSIGIFAIGTRLGLGRSPLGLLCIGAVLVASLLSWLAGRSALRSINELSDTVSRLGDGDLKARVPVRGPAEIRSVGVQINNMASQLEEAGNEIAREHADLKLKSTDRTRELQQANRLLMDIANRDSLTGLANRRRLELELDRHIQLSRRNRIPLAVILMDLDDFKIYNDAAGHLAGDTLLQTVATVLRARARSTDLVVRWGGDEFCILVPGASPHGAIVAAEGFVQAVQEAANRLPLPESLPPVGASAGVACFPGDGEDGTELIAAADAALYRVKETGRGKVLRAQDRA